MSALSWIIVILSIPLIALALFGLHHLALRLEARGLLYYRNKKPEGSGSAPLGALQEIYEPAIQHVLHIKDEKRVRGRRATGKGMDEPPMMFLDVTLPTIEENLALDEALLLEAEAGRRGEVLRVWEWPTPAIILGAGGRMADEVDEPACQADGVPVLRRSSGGGTVMLGRGCLLYSLVLSYDRAPPLREVRASYCYILGRMQETLADLLPGVTCAGTSDLAADGFKFSGNAQQRKRDHILHHGTLLYDFDVDEMSRYLRLPTRQPEYRAGREHANFVRNLPCGVNELTRRISQSWKATTRMDEWPIEIVRELILKKYGSPEWNRRR
jgi:lipoate-protein ligase A